jgi:hypothetical protein
MAIVVLFSSLVFVTFVILGFVILFFSGFFFFGSGGFLAVCGKYCADNELNTKWKKHETIINDNVHKKTKIEE